MTYWIEITNTPGGIIAVDGVVYTEPDAGREEISEHVANIVKRYDVAGCRVCLRGKEITGFQLNGEEITYLKLEVGDPVRFTLQHDGQERTGSIIKIKQDYRDPEDLGGKILWSLCKVKPDAGGTPVIVKLTPADRITECTKYRSQ